MKKTLKRFRNTTWPAALAIFLGICAASLGSVAAAGISPQTCTANGGHWDATTNTCQTDPSGSGSSSGGGAAAPTSSTPKVTRYDPSGAEQDPALHSGNCANLDKCDLINNYINPAINFMIAFVGLGVTIAIVYGGIEYGSSGGDPAKAASGKNHIRNAIFTLIAFFFLYALLNFLIPGGVNS